MNINLMTIFIDYIEIIHQTNGVLGAWKFGSETHGLSDELSDVDVCLLVEGGVFDSLVREQDRILSEICDKIVLRWEESFNSSNIVNNGYLIKKGNQIFQFDIFMLNTDMLDDYICRIHYTDLSEKDIIFDHNGILKRICENSPHGNLYNADIDYLSRTYYYHTFMSAKYLLRSDYFKLSNVVRTLYETHVSLLLTAYDKISWGGEANKLYFIPHDKQEHLKRYYCTDDFKSNRSNLLRSIIWFNNDLEELLKAKDIDDENTVGKAVTEEWIKTTSTPTELF